MQELKQGTSPLLRVAALQSLLTAILSGFLWSLDGIAAYSGLLGGLACILPTLYMHLASQGLPILGSGLAKALKGELGRVAITVAVFLLVFALVKPFNVLAFFGVFAALQFAYWMVLIRQ